MSLEKVDIQDVMSEVAQGRLVHIKLNDENSLHAAVACLEQKDFGDISIWSPEKLFQIEKALCAPENQALKKRWDAAIAINTKVRMNLLKCKALEKLENFNDETKAPTIAFCKTLLISELTESVSSVRAKYYNAKTESDGMTRDDHDEMSNLSDQL